MSHCWLRSKKISGWIRSLWPSQHIVWETARLWHSVDPTCSPLVIQSSSLQIDQLTNTTYRATVHWTVDLELKSHPKDVEEQEHGDGHFLSLTEAGFPAVVWRGQHASGVRIMWEWDTTFFLVHGQNTIENEENPENPGGVLAAEKAGCLMQISKREAVNSSMMAAGRQGWEDYTAVPGSLTQLEGASSCLEHLYRSLQTPEKCQGSNVFDCKKPCSRWNLDLGFCLLPRAAKMSWSWKFDIYIQWGGSKSRKVWKREMNNSM